MLTDQRRLAKLRMDRITRQAFKDAIAIFDTKTAMLGNPFSGDTTVLDHTVDNHTDVLPQTEEEVIQSVLFPKHNIRNKKSDIKLVPDMVTEDVKDYYRQKIGASLLRSAVAKQKNL